MQLILRRPLRTKSNIQTCCRDDKPVFASLQWHFYLKHHQIHNRKSLIHFLKNTFSHNNANSKYSLKFITFGLVLWSLPVLQLTELMLFCFTTERRCLQRWVWQSVKMEALWVYFLLKRYSTYTHIQMVVVEWIVSSILMHHHFLTSVCFLSVGTVCCSAVHLISVVFFFLSFCHSFHSLSFASFTNSA